MLSPRVLRPLFEKFSNLKVVVGYENAAPEQDTLIPKVMEFRPILKEEDGITRFGVKSVRVPWHTDLMGYSIGSVVRKECNKWKYYTRTEKFGRAKVKDIFEL